MDIKLFCVVYFHILCFGLCVAQNNARDYYMMNARLRQQPNGLLHVDRPPPPSTLDTKPQYNPHVIRVDPQPAVYPAPSRQSRPTVVYSQNPPSGPPQQRVVYAQRSPTDVMYDQNGRSRTNVVYASGGPPRSNVVYAQSGPPRSNVVYAQSGPPRSNVVYAESGPPAQRILNAPPRPKVFYSPSSKIDPPRASVAYVANSQPEPIRPVMYAQTPRLSHLVSTPNNSPSGAPHVVHHPAPHVVYAPRDSVGQQQNTRVIYAPVRTSNTNSPSGQPPKVVDSPSPQVVYAQNPPIVYDPNPRPMQSSRVVYAQNPRVVYAQSPPVVYAQAPQVVYVPSPQTVYAQSPGQRQLVMLAPGTQLRSTPNITNQNIQMPKLSLPKAQQPSQNPVLHHPLSQGVGTTVNPLAPQRPLFNGIEFPKPRLVNAQNTILKTTTPSNSYVAPTTSANFDAYQRIMNSSLPTAEGLPTYCRVDPRTMGLYCVIPNGNTLQYDQLRQWSVNAGIDKSVYVTCMPGGTVALSWPIRAMNIVNLNLRNCAIIDFFKYMGTSSVIPDKLQHLELYNSKIIIKISELAVLIKRSNQLRAAFSTVNDCGQKTMKKYVFKDMKFEVLSENLTFGQYSKIGRFLDKFLQMTKLQTCTYPNLMHLDESGSKLSSLYHQQLLTNNAVFPKLKSYLSSGIGLTEIPKELSSFTKHFPCMVYLDLSNNMITAAKFNLEFRGECLTPSTDPVYINLRNNRITVLAPIQIEFLLDSRIILDLQGNPINCAVQSNTLRQYAMDMSLAFPNYTAILNATPCFSPKEIAKAMPPLPPVPGMPLSGAATSALPGLPDSIIPPGPPPGMPPLPPGMPPIPPGIAGLPPAIVGFPPTMTMGGLHAGLSMDMPFIPGMPMSPVPGMTGFDFIPHPFGELHPVPPPSLAV